MGGQSSQTGMSSDTDSCNVSHATSIPRSKTEHPLEGDGQERRNLPDTEHLATKNSQLKNSKKT